MDIAVSACLLGYKCRYDGKTNKNDLVIALGKEHNLCPICPEVYGNLGTPRSPSEIIGDKVFNKDGIDVTDNFNNGANLAYKIVEMRGIKYAILKAKSPSCGKGLVYDGTFSGKLCEGDGVTTKLFKEKGIMVYTENDDWNFI